MRIRDLEINNFRNLDLVKISPRKIDNRDLVVLIGENNVGKTSVLELLNMLFNPERSIRTLNFEETDFHDITKPITVNIVFEDLGDELLAQFHDVLDEIPGENRLGLLPLTFTCTYDSKTNECEPQLVFTRLPYRSVSVAEKKMISFYLQDALRDYRTMYSTRNSLLARILREIDFSEEETALLQKLQDVSQIVEGNNEIVQLKKTIHEVASKIIDLSQDPEILRFALAAPDSAGLKRNIRFQMRKPDSDSYLEVDEVGLGLQSVLTLSVFRAFAGVGQLRDGIFAIDEPEAHLHPSAQRAMFREIVNLSEMRQVWIATHSTVLVEHIDPRHIVRLKKDRNGKASAIQLPFDFPSDYVISYERHLDAGKSEAFFSKSVLLVEGPTEQGFFPAASLVLAKESPLFNFDRIGVSVVHAQGKTNIKAFARLLKNFEIPCQVILDWDAEKRDDDIVEEIKEITPHVFQYDHEPKMGDIEGVLCLNVPIVQMIQFEDEILPEDSALSLMEQLRQAIQRVDSYYSTQISDIRRRGGRLSEICEVVESFIKQHPESERNVREVLAKGLRKVKNRTTGRLLAEKFTMYLPQSLKECIRNVIRLAGYDIEGN